jgi:O-antigen ligase
MPTRTSVKGNPAAPLAALAPQASLALLGTMASLSFLNFFHTYPLPTFYTEWTAFTLGTAALLALPFAPRGERAAIPFLTVGLVGLLLVLLIQVAAGMIVYVERSLLGALYALWAALLVWLGAYLRERVGLERAVRTLQVFTAFGGFLVAMTGFVMYYGIEIAGFRLISGVATEGMFGTVGQRNNFANYLGCALASVVFLRGQGRLGLPLATLLAAPIALALVLSVSRSAWVFVALTALSAVWTFWLGDRGRCKPLLRFSLFALGLFAFFNVLAAETSWFAGPEPQSASLAGRWLQTLIPGEGRLGVRLRGYLFEEAWRMFTEHPWLGVGFGQFACDLLEHGASFNGVDSSMDRHSHNAPLQLLAETGLAGALCVAVPLASWLRRLPWSRPSVETGWIIAVVAIEAAHSMVEFPLWHANFLGLTAIVLGYAARPALELSYSRLRQAALGAVVLAGVATAGKVFADYRSFEGWYQEVDALQRRKLPITSTQLDELADLRANSFFAGYYDMLAAEIVAWNRENLQAKLELNARVLRFIPIPTAVLRQAVLLSLQGEHGEAARVLSRLATIYPSMLPEYSARIEELAREDPAAFGALAEEARRLAARRPAR